MKYVDFRMPALGADMESGTLTQWLKRPGERVLRGDALAVVETAKGLIDIESFDDGVLEQIVAQEGATVPVGAVLARIACEPEPSSPPALATEATAAIPAPGSRAAPPGPDTGPTAAPQQVTTPATRLRVSPAARRRALELGVDLAAVEGSDAQGVIRIEDIERLAGRAAAAPPPAPAAAGPRADMRAAIGAAMARSKREIPHYYLAHDVDFGAARDWLTGFNTGVPAAQRLVDAVLLVKAIALAVREIEGFNGHFGDGQFRRSDRIHVGVAIALRGGGLVAPALFDCDRKDLATLMREFSELVMRVRSGRMRSGELSAATVTLSNLGDEAVRAMFPIINPPQVAILGAGTVLERPWVVEGRLAVRPVLTLTLAADHRVSDGRTGARVLRRIGELLARPDTL